MRIFLSLLVMLLPWVALAHPGHMIEVAGHDHIVAGVAIGVAIGVAVWGAIKGRRDDEADEPDAEETAADDLQDA